MYYYERGTDKLIGDYNRGGYSFADTNDLSDRYGKYHINSVLQREFAYFLDIPNQDGSPYTTPKDLGLTWIKSTGSVDVFGITIYNYSINTISNLNYSEVLGQSCDWLDTSFFIQERIW